MQFSCLQTETGHTLIYCQILLCAEVLQIGVYRCYLSSSSVFSVDQMAVVPGLHCTSPQSGCGRKVNCLPEVVDRVWYAGVYLLTKPAGILSLDVDMQVLKKGSWFCTSKPNSQ